MAKLLEQIHSARKLFTFHRDSRPANKNSWHAAGVSTPPRDSAPANCSRASVPPEMPTTRRSASDQYFFFSNGLVPKNSSFMVTFTGSVMLFTHVSMRCFCSAVPTSDFTDSNGGISCETIL